MKSRLRVRAKNEYLEAQLGLREPAGGTTHHTLAEALAWAEVMATDYQLELKLPETPQLVVALLEQAASPAAVHLRVAREILALPVANSLFDGARLIDQANSLFDDCLTDQANSLFDEARLIDTIVDAAKAVLDCVGVPRAGHIWHHRLKGCAVQAAVVKDLWRIL